jgi:DNA-binding NarL/FixJ family response regulator
LAPTEAPSRGPEDPESGVLIVDDAASTRLILRTVLEKVNSLKVTGEASSGKSAVEAAGELHPDIILLDLSLPDTSGESILSDLLERAPQAKIIILSNNSRIAGPDLVTAGATGYIEKGLTPQALVDQLSDVLQRPLTLSSALTEL